MISITIKLHSAVDLKTTVLGRMLIWNKGTQPSPKLGDYGVAVLKKGQEGTFDEDDYHTWRKPSEDKTTRKGEVTNYPRLSYNVWRLITRALKSAFP